MASDAHAPDELRDRVAFAVGTGRCGTQFLAKVVACEPDMASVHERNPLVQTFHRYCKWYQLPVDDEGFLHVMESEVRADLNARRFSFEASAYVSLSIEELYQRLGARFVLLVRRPDRVVNSYLAKGWYDRPIIQNDASLALGYQPTDEFHHFLGRIAPLGDQFEPWRAMTRIGKLAWYWSALNRQVLQQFERLPPSHRRVERLEDLDYERYVEVARFLGFEPTVSRQSYDQLVTQRPNARIEIPALTAWNQRNISEFESQVGPLASELNYEFRVAELRQQALATASDAGRDSSLLGRLLGSPSRTK